MSLLGSGGMGDVWLAHNETLDIEVAIKLVRPRAGDKDAEGRLLAEARAAARLGHPAIVRVFDFGQTENGTPYIVMERLLGEDLATALGRLGRLSPVKAVRTLLPVVHALSVAHHKGIVHRDLKPENVFLAKVEGDRLQPKIVDFGIARVDRNVRRSGATAAFGSPSYMSPEQVRGEDGDSRMDQWSLSVVLYEAIAGKRPFSASTTDALLVAITDDPPEPLPALPGTDEALQKILLRGLAKAPADRYPTMRELGEALVDWLMARDVHEDISGASVEALFERGSEDALGTIRPGAAPVEQESLGTDTVIRSSRAAPRAVAAPRPGPPPVLILIAVVAGVLGVALGVVLGWKPKAPAPLPSASVAPATPPGPSAPIPVEPLEAIPVDLGAGAAASAEKPKSRAPEVRTFRKPKRSLKDPFQ
ncbi:MAG TPA: serine/threonine-protein kinase [Polyangiaceae bacterium]|nr:serine/threonine-protein kinase [Polyangiaceae bacterium]